MGAQPQLPSQGTSPQPGDGCNPQASWGHFTARPRGQQPLSLQSWPTLMKGPQVGPDPFRLSDFLQPERAWAELLLQVFYLWALFIPSRVSAVLCHKSCLLLCLDSQETSSRLRRP